MNKKGFAISSILYLLILITGLFFATTLALLTFRKNVLQNKINTINNELDGGVVNQYRYMTETGEWSSWLNYNNVNDINYSFNVSKIVNTGTLGASYDLVATDVTLNIVAGESHLSFNGATSNAVSNSNNVETVANTIIIEVKKNNNGDVVSFMTGATSYPGVYYDANNKLNIKLNDSTQTSIPAYPNNNTYRYVLVLNKAIGNYNVYHNGTLIGTTSTSTIARFNLIRLGYFIPSDSRFFKGDINLVALSSVMVTDSEAISLSKIGGYPNEFNLLSKGLFSIKYGPFIEYRKVASKDEFTTNSTFKTRYIKDYMQGTITSSTNEILEIEAYAKFNKGEKFHDVMVGGSYTGTFAKDKNAANQTTLGKIRITSGTFTHINGNTFVIPEAIEVVTPFLTSASFGSGLIMFGGADKSRFQPTLTNYFVYVEYGDKDSSGINKWYYYTGSNWVMFEPNLDDAIVGYSTKRYNESVLSDVLLFTPYFSFNIALGKTLTSDYGVIDTAGQSITAIVDGTTQTKFINGTGLKYVEIDLGIEYEIEKVNLFHQYLPYPITSLNTKTILYDEARKNSYVLWDSSVKGLYGEEISGKGITLFVDQTKMSHTHKTRYLLDECAGWYTIDNPIRQNGSAWIEIEIIDYNGYNIGLGKTGKTTGSTATLSRINDGNKTSTYNAGNGLQRVMIDLGYEYAIKEVNIMHNYFVNYVYLDTKTILLNGEIKDPNIIYDSGKEGVYTESTNGIRLVPKIIIKGETETIPPLPSLP